MNFGEKNNLMCPTFNDLTFFDNIDASDHWKEKLGPMKVCEKIAGGPDEIVFHEKTPSFR